MSSFITDQHAMDPDILVSLWSTRTTWTVGVDLWKGLARSWGLGICVVLGLAVSQWGASVCLTSLWIVPVIIFLKDHFLPCSKVGGGAWLTVLQNAALIASTASSLSITLDHMANGKWHQWIHEHIGDVEVLALATVCSVTFLFVLGLERSTLLRAILIASVSLCVVFFAIVGTSLIDYTLVKQVTQPPKSYTEVLQAAGFLASAYAGVTHPHRSTNASKYSYAAALSMCVASYSVVIVLLAITVEQQSANPAVYLLKVFEIRDLWWARETLAVFIILALSLSLPELLSSGQSSVVALGGNILSSVISKENRTTGTQIYAISVIGVLSCFLVLVCSLKNLLTLTSVTFLLTQVVELISATNVQYQPSILPKNLGAGYLDYGKNYSLVPPDSTELLNSSEDELSDDSGHSSDTDIDAIVAEYKEKIKVVTTLTEPLSLDPTVATSRRVTLSLLSIVILSTLNGFSLIHRYYWISIVSVIIQVSLLGVIVSQPFKPESRASKYPSWLAITILSVDIILVCHLVMDVLVVLLLWTVLGIVCWCHTKRYIVCSKGNLKHRKERIKLRMPPSHHTVTSYLPNYRRMTHVDTVLVTR